MICGRQILLADATLGPADADGNAAIICDGHLRDERRFIGLLADYCALLTGSNVLRRLADRGRS